VYHISGHTDAGSCASIRSLVDAAGLGTA
jgi:hypothetical protein